MAEKIELLIIDPQVDFCNPQKGALYVNGAEEDMDRLSQMVDRIGKKISKIDVTLDCHHKIDVAHPGMWRNSEGDNPAPFTIITSQDIKSGKWLPIYPSEIKRFTQYTESLEASGRYPLCIWPPHCLIGTEGNNVFPVLAEALDKWVDIKRRNINYVSKGSNIFTEHYSAIKAEVPDPTDPTTQIDSRDVGLISSLMKADVVAIAGEAGSHCLANTVRDIADGFNDDSYVQKLVLLEDATSPVAGFENFQEDFIKEMTARGMQISNTVDFLTN